jgi:hypothetical protein
MYKVFKKNLKNEIKPIDIQPEMVYVRIQKEVQDGSILCQVPSEERYEGCQSYCHEEQTACNFRDLPDLWDQDVQNWQSQINCTKEVNGQKPSFFAQFGFLPVLPGRLY